MKIRNKVINIFRNILLIIGLIFAVSIIILSCGLALIVFDSIKQKECDDWMLMEEWERKETKEKLRMENKSIKASIWTPKIEKEEKRK